jgi:hypothetical protein
MNISQRMLKTYVAAYPPAPTRTQALEQRIQIGTGFHGKWYRSQREHWLGWVEFQDRKALEAGQSPNALLAKAVWNRLKCSPMMFWLAECSGVSADLLSKAETEAAQAAVLNPKDGNPHGRMIRSVLPWPVLESAIANGPAASSLSHAQQEADLAFDRLCELRPRFRAWREIA